MIDLSVARSHFRYALPETRLGQQHFTLNDFRKHVKSSNLDRDRDMICPMSKEYTLIVVTEHNTKRILLGKKHRGFGKGMYNAFGGKVEQHERNCIPASAIRELHEETGISIHNESLMESCRVGTLRFTFEDNTTEMIVHLFRIIIQFDDKKHDYDVKRKLDPKLGYPNVITVPCRSIIRECEEITPVWFDDWTNIPLHEMFADDSIWLTNLLASATSKSNYFNGWFHFQEGGQETNTILHYFLDTVTPTSLN